MLNLGKNHGQSPLTLVTNIIFNCITSRPYSSPKGDVYCTRTSWLVCIQYMSGKYYILEIPKKLRKDFKLTAT